MNTLKICLLTLSALVASVGFGLQQGGTTDNVKITKGSDDFVLVETDKYRLEVPNGWAVGKQTPWGARDIVPGSGSGQMGAMTAGPTQDSWERLYETSLFFIKREAPGKETPYRTGKTKLGYESISFEVLDANGFAARRYTLLKNHEGNVLALSIKIPSREQEKSFLAMFQHMVDTATLKS